MKVLNHILKLSAENGIHLPFVLVKVFFLLCNRGRCLNQSIATKVWHLAYLILIQWSNAEALLNFLATILTKGTQVAFHNALLWYKYKAFMIYHDIAWLLREKRREAVQRVEYTKEKREILGRRKTSDSDIWAIISSWESTPKSTKE